MQQTKEMVSLGRKGCLTEAMTDSFQNYYGSVNRRNVGNLEEMRKAVLAIYHHSVSDAKAQYNYCPKDEISWCKYQQAVGRKEAEHFAHKKTIPPDVAKAICGIFIDLADPKLLERCMMGATQNQNEAIHHILGSLCSKAGFQSKTTVELSVALAVSWWNNGASSLLKILQRLSIEPGVQTELYVKQADKKRLKKSEIRERDTVKQARKRRWLKMKIDKTVEKEGTTYAPGEF